MFDCKGISSPRRVSRPFAWSKSSVAESNGAALLPGRGRLRFPGGGARAAKGFPAGKKVRHAAGMISASVLALAVVGLTGCNKGLIAVSPLAGVKLPSNYVLPPENLYDGNSTSVGNSASDSSVAMLGAPGTLLMRQPDCSLSGEVFTNFALTTSAGYTGTFSGTFTATATPNYGSTLHKLASLGKTGGTFADGCTDKTSGISGLPAVLLAKTSSGTYVGASIDLNNNLYIGAIDPAGSFTATRLTNIMATALYVGDLNSEGIRELIVLGFVPNTGSLGLSSVVSTINVHADGTSDAPVTLFSPASTTAVSSLTVDDFTGDGNLDIGMAITTNQGYLNQPFSVLPGKGDGTFGAVITSVTPTGFSGSALTGDFNGDGKRDVILGTSVLFGKGDGTFMLGAVAAPGGVSLVGDFNNDGKDDLAVVASNTGNYVINIYLGKGDGTFTTTGPAYASLYSGETLALTDIDGDGNLDLVVGQGHSGIYAPPQYGQGITMFLMGNGDGTFHGAYAYPNSAGSGAHGAFAAGDFNRDGNVDVLTFDRGSLGHTFGIKLLTGNGHGLLTPQPTNTTALPIQIAAADVDGDGKLDAVVQTSTTDNSGNIVLSLAVLKGNGDGTFGAPTSFPIVTVPAYDASNMALGDIRGVGKPDVIASENGGLYYLKNNGDGTFATAVQIDTQDDFGALVVADINGDGKADIIATSAPQSSGPPTSGKLLVYLSHGDGTFAAAASVTSYTSGADMIVADVNKDGKPDIEFLSSDTSGVSSLNVLLGKGDGTFSPNISTVLTGTALFGLAAADVNGDGNPDLLIGACCGNTLASISYGNGDGTFSTNTGLSIGPSTNGVAFADLNNDGRPDLLLATNQQLVTSLNEFGTTSTLAATTTTLVLSPSSPVAGQSVTFKATVAPSTGSGTPTGTVTFYDGTTSLGTGTLASGVASSTAALTAGSHSITASYVGDTTYSESVSPAVNVTVSALAPTATKLTASATTAVSGSSLTFTASISETAGSATPTGMVTFYDGSTSLGSGTLASGAASFSTTSLSVGTHTITATYAGDSSNATSTSAGVSVTITTVVAADFSLALNSTSGSVSQGSSVTSTITITPLGGFNQQVNLTCSGLPARTLCTFSPTSVTPSGTNVAASTLTIKTDVKTAAWHQPLLPGQTSGGVVTLASLEGAGLLGFLLLSSRRKNKRWWSLQLGLILALVATSAVTGCGRSGATTPKGTSQITITGTGGSTMHSATYSLTVQ